MHKIFKAAILSLFAFPGLGQAQAQDDVKWTRVKGAPTCEVLQVNGRRNQDVWVLDQVPVRGTNCPSESLEGKKTLIITGYTQEADGWVRLSNGWRYNRKLRTTHYKF